MNKKFTAYNDPGHGWVAVKTTDLEYLGISHLISPYSYAKGGTVYLEEDSDFEKFLTAYEEKIGCKPEIEDRYTDGNSPIRSYASYIPDRKFLEPFAVTDVSTAAEFVEKYSKEDTFSPIEYRIKLASWSLSRNGYTLIPEYASESGQVVAFFLPS